jgi:hypothetical protein
MWLKKCNLPHGLAFSDRYCAMNIGAVVGLEHKDNNRDNHNQVILS